MSIIKVTKDVPCPICGKPDWCFFSEMVDGVVCMRIESEKPTRNGGWFHWINKETKVVKPKPVVEKPQIPIYPTWVRWNKNTKPEHIFCLASQLGVSEQSLIQLRTVWAEERQAWGFPMFDAQQRMVGIRLRNHRGDKWSVTGGHEGIFRPDELFNPVLIVEGPTDCAAALSSGLCAIGRPNCSGGVETIRDTIIKERIRTSIIVADNDDKEHKDGKYYNPGLDGAERLSSQMPCSHYLWQPPTKDFRDWISTGGNKAILEVCLYSLVSRRANSTEGMK